MTAEFDYDIAIVGGGMVGATMACALHGLGLRIAVIEAFAFRSDNQPSYDARSIALAYGSRRIVEALGMWPSMKDEVTPIHDIHVSDRGQFGVTRLNALQENVPALGYVVENRVMGNALVDALNARDDISLLCPARVSGIGLNEDHAELSIEQEGVEQCIRVRLVIAADGGNSAIRSMLKIDSTRREYGQTAIIANVTPSNKHENVAYERFTESGPLALLPMSENRCSLVLTTRDEDVEQVMGLDDDAFLSLLNERFGYRLGKFIKTSKRFTYPLSLIQTKEHARQGLVIIGNAAHTLHPMAGQGFNLGIRDVSELAQVIADAQRQGQDIGSMDVLKRYVQRRMSDHRGVITFTDSVARLFSNELSPLAHLRSKGLVVADIFPSVKHRLAKHAMGIAGRLPRLSRGLPL